MPDATTRFMRRIQLGPNGCIEWTGCTNRAGYGKIHAYGKPTLTHRFMWQLARGPIPDGLHVCHKCDNPRCVNVDHLFLGTDADNLADMRAKARGSKPPLRRGSNHRNAKLTEDDVRAIRSDLRSQSVIAREYGIDQTNVSHIRLWKSWRHVT